VVFSVTHALLRKLVNRLTVYAKHVGLYAQYSARSNLCYQK